MASMRTPGSRVFAVLDADAASVRLLGFGTYAGDEVPPYPMGLGALWGATWEEHDAALAAEGWTEPVRPKNPKIVLDDGEVVWGAECWWAPEAQYAKFRGDRAETRASIVEARNRQKKESAE